MVVAMDAARRLTAAGGRSPGEEARPLLRLAGVIAAEGSYGRPVGRNGRKGRGQRGVVAGSPDDLAAEQGQVALDLGDLILGHGEVVPVQRDQVGQLPDLDPPLLALFVGEPSVSVGPKPQGGLAILTGSRSVSILAGISGRGSRKSSKSAAE